jgi:hypothetical protein
LLKMAFARSGWTASFGGTTTFAAGGVAPSAVLASSL